MNPRYSQPVLLSLLLAGTCFGQIEFVGYMSIPSDSRFVLREPAEGRVSEWIKLGDAFAGYTLTAYDRKTELITLEKPSARLNLTLKTARIHSGPSGSQKNPPRFAVGTVRIKFAAESPVSEQAARDIMQLRPGAEFDEPSLDRAIRALHRTGHFKTIEIKRDQPTPETIDLEVTVTPKTG